MRLLSGQVRCPLIGIEHVQQLTFAPLVSGGLCGGIFVDAKFMAMCKSRLGRRWSRLSLANIKHVMDSEWETKIKLRFESTSRKPNIVAIPNEAFRGADRNDTDKEPRIINGSIHFSRLAEGSVIVSSSDSQFQFGYSKNVHRSFHGY